MTQAALKTDTESDAIVIIGAREHNLKNISLEIPRGQIVVVTGVSGSGKSTLAFDLVFSEGQRRFLDSMNAYARQFVEQLPRPDVDFISGIPPTVSIEQRNSRGGGKSTVATVTEIYHFLRLLFARLGTQHCPDCNIPVSSQTRDEVGASLAAAARKRGDLLLLAPVVRTRKGFHTEVAEWAARKGFAELRADGKIHKTSQRMRLDRFKEHSIEVVIGVFEAKGKKANPATRQALVDSALALGKGTLFALDNRQKLTIHSTERSCTSCGRSFEPLDPKHFSYNASTGWCPKCRGFGELFYLPKVDRGARADAIEESWFGWQEGKREPCPACHGARLNPVSRAVRLDLGKPFVVGGKKTKQPATDQFAAATVLEGLTFFKDLVLTGKAGAVARDILPEIRERLHFLSEVGLGYLQLGRSVTTLSGGEAQRIRLSAQLGSNLSGVLYVLDEPTIGLHVRDNLQLLDTLEKLKARGNSLLIVEHDEDTMRRADWVIDLGPGAGVRGGEVIAQGILSDLEKNPASLTGRCLSEVHNFPSRGARRQVVTRGKAATPMLTIAGAGKHNLKKLTVNFPLNRLTVVTGVSGSGKSTLVRECLLPAVTAAIAGKKGPGDCGTVTGFKTFDSVHEVEQSPIGRTPRSTPATYVGFFSHIRDLFSQTPEARMRGFGPSRFSFNSNQGRCPTCEGAGMVKMEMNFLPTAWVRCETCLGLRFNPETLTVHYKDKTIAEVMDMSIEEGVEFFANLRAIHRPLQALCDTGLGYLKLGQTSPTLSGGEAQRVKLVTHLLGGLNSASDAARQLRRKPKQHLFILEEPTIGLHISDVRKLLEILNRLVDAGHTVIVIEHNPDLIAEADWLIDIGPEGGEAGGKVVGTGTPEEVAKVTASHTGAFLKTWLQRA